MKNMKKMLSKKEYIPLSEIKSKRNLIHIINFLHNLL